MPPHHAEVRVVHRNLRWEVRALGVTRPLIDWLCTKERAIDHAIDRAREVGAEVVLVENSEGGIEEILPAADRPSERRFVAA
jgi:hypothetical protein